MVHIKIDKRNEEPGVAKHIRFYDKFHQQIRDAVAYDPSTGIGLKVDPYTGNTKEYYDPDGLVEVDHVANPSDDDMQNYRLLNKAKHFKHMTDEEKDELIKELKKMK